MKNGILRQRAGKEPIDMSIRRVVIVGAGAAGLMAASVAKHRADEVVIFERNKIAARKVRITGKGRCNITNIADTEEILENITCNRRFMYSALYGFTNYDVMTFFEDMGVSVKTERGGRVFPVSDSAHDVAEALLKAAKGDNVRIINKRVTKLMVKNSEIVGVMYEGGSLECDSVIIATGGKSYPLTGSDGSGYTLASDVGHSIIFPKPSLVPLITKQKWVSELMGLSLKNVRLTVYEDNKQAYTDFGEMLFTHFGISGPLVLSASAHMRNFEKKSYRAEIDLKPALDEKQLDARILKDFEEAGKKHIINALDKLLPKALIPVIIKISGIDPHKDVTSVTKEERYNLGKALKSLSVDITGTRPIDEAIITSGGINTKEINPSTMESKLVSGLFFAGEVIDVDAYTGGYNLQIAFSTGHLAGENA